MVFISTAGHGYLKVTINQLKKAYSLGFKPTSFSFFNASTVLLEEDCDMPNFMKIMFPIDSIRINKLKRMKYIEQNDINRRIYSSTPASLNEFEDGLKIYTLNSSFIGKYML